MRHPSMESKQHPSDAEMSAAELRERYANAKVDTNKQPC